MSGIPQVIVVSGNARRPKAARGRKTKAKARSASKSRSERATSTPTRSSVSANESDREDAFSALSPEENDNEEPVIGNSDIEAMEEDSLSSRRTESEGQSDKDLPTTSQPPGTKKRKKPKATGPPPLDTFINQTAFDVYFAHASTSLRISNNLLSSLIEPLSHDEAAATAEKIQRRAEENQDIIRLNEAHKEYFPHYWWELTNGFNLLFYGYGSKRQILTDFGKSYCSKRGHVVVINGYKKGSTLKAILSAIENIPSLENMPLRSQGLDDQLWRIYDFFRDERNAPLYLIIHNIESPPLRDQKVKQFLIGIALHPRIHLVASMDNIQASLLWSSVEISARKHPTTPLGSDVPSSRGFSWLFHELTTFLPYINEMKSRDLTALPSQNLASSGATAPGQALTEAAMTHILASVTEKAKRLFRLLASRQIAAIDEGGEKQQVGVGGLDKYGMQYDLLFNEARKDFLATSDTALRALLGEFMDHEMIKAGGQPEVLWIPATKEVIRRALQSVDS